MICKYRGRAFQALNPPKLILISLSLVQLLFIIVPLENVGLLRTRGVFLLTDVEIGCHGLKVNQLGF